jgi:oleate hydratase
MIQISFKSEGSFMMIAASLLEIHNSRPQSPYFNMTAKVDCPHRQPNHIQAWLIGNGIASISAAVHFINDAKVPGTIIHILDLHSGSGGGMNSSVDAQNGYFLPFECRPHFHGTCMERLLSLVPSQGQPGRSMMDRIRSFENIERPPP